MKPKLKRSPINVAKGVATIEINDYIGMGGFYAQTLRDTLAKYSAIKEINVSICSQGGNIVEGLAIYNMLANHAAPVNVEITGIAASMASVIAMAGDTIRMAKNSFMMIHNPAGGVDGESEDMRKQADVLDKMRDMLADIYAKRTGQDIEDVIEAMSKETWMTADEALALGYCTEVTPEKTMAARLDLSGWKNAPKALRRAIAKGNRMDPDLLKKLGLPEDATAEDIAAALDILQRAAAAAVKAGLTDADDYDTEADPEEETDPKKKKAAKARAQREAREALNQNGNAAILAALGKLDKKIDGSERDKLIAANVKKFTPALEKKARAWPIDVLRDFCETAVDAPEESEEPEEGAQTERGPRAKAKEITLSATDKLVAKNIGMSEEDFLKAKKTDAARAALKVVA